MMKYILIFTALSTIGCAASIPVQKDEAFAFAVEAVQEDSFVQGAGAAWSFIDAADPDDPRYDRGLRLLARSAEGLELSWAAGMIYRQIAQERRNMELVPDALSGLERIVKSEVYDEDILITSFIASEEFGYLPEEVQAFVDYYHGLDLARRGADDWARVRFEKLPEGSPYAARAKYVLAVRLVVEGDFPEAIKILEELRKIDKLESDLLRDVERTLARLAFEEQRYEDALSRFETLKELAPDDPEILLEMAWTHFYLGDSRKTLGLLIALDAPIHMSYISPERYLLEALALRRLCQFGAARQAAVRLEGKYENSLRELSQGTLPKEISKLRTAAEQRGRSRGNTRFLERLKMEMSILSSLSEELGEGLYVFLNDFYTRGFEEVKRRSEELIARDVAELTEELLSAREGVRLIVHELGVSLLRGRRRPAGAQEKPAVDVPITGERVFYPHRGEYWTDELDDLVVIAEDRCID
ncbi:MAG: hypothetical protein GY847_37300 [Proteobacteria bacterium]|nr:hypothetical protein [Pseudomonadota bacterium]